MAQDTNSTPAYSPDEAREAYLNLADELTDYGSARWLAEGGTAPLDEGDWDADWLRAAKGYAALRGLPFPPADIDTAAASVKVTEALAAAGWPDPDPTPPAEDAAVAAEIGEADRLIAEAKALGAEAGRRAASWLDAGEAGVSLAVILRGFTDGDPAVLDAIYLPDLSGEWADGMTPAALAEAVGLADGDDGLEDICEAWETAVQDAYFGAVHDRLKDINPTALEAATRVDSPAPAAPFPFILSPELAAAVAPIPDSPAPVSPRAFLVILGVSPDDDTEPVHYGPFATEAEAEIAAERLSNRLAEDDTRPVSVEALWPYNS